MLVTVSPELLALRAEIDAADEVLAAALANRFRIVDRVIAVKAAHGIPAMLPDRIEEVVDNARCRAGHVAVPPEHFEAIWRALIAETIRYEDARLPAAPAAA
jgi:isochorismate pyruvate lyase